MLKKQLSGRSKVAILALVVALALPMTLPSAAYAGTLFTYNGQRICGKASIKSATIKGSTCTVTHTQTRNYASHATMRVQIQKKNGILWTTVAQRDYRNNVSAKKLSSWLNSGTYRLYFSTVSGSNTFNISGRFSN